MKARVLLVATLVALVGCTGGTSSSSAPPSGMPSPSDTTEPVQLKVATFNIEYGGEVIDFDKVVEAALLLDADVIGIEEAWGNIPELAEGMGWPYYDPRTQLVSKLPLLAPPDGSGTYDYVEVEPGRVVAIGNVHLPSAPYGPRLALLDRAPDAVIALEDEVRVPALEAIATPLADLATSGMPVFVVGDFNAPSHLDWIEEMVGSRPQVRFPLAWPTSMLMENLGYRDSFREVHPDPVAEPGLTWPAARPRIPDGWNPGAKSLADRIDFVYAAGPVETVDSIRLGEEGAADLSVTPYPTDHRGVVSTFLVEPAPPPTLVSAVHRSVDAGGDVEIFFHTPDDAGASVAIVGPGGEEVASQGTEGATDGSLPFASASWNVGAYEAVLSDGSGAELARSPFWIVDPDAEPTITVADATVGIGEPVEVSWAGTAGNRWDWLGVYEQGADPNVASYLLWEYTGATVEGSTSFGPDSEGTWPLEAGAYTVYLLEDDSYVALAGADFTVEG